MSRQINQPINQVRLTNVAVVRMNKGGKRFEIACYRNKVMDYRKGLETDLSEVLQSDRVFTNVSKGQFAKHSDLQKVFGTKDEDVIAHQILDKGQLQVSDLERHAQQEQTMAQIATWVANHCVHPTSQRPYTVTQIRHALGKQYQVQPHKAIKKQYLDCVKFLKTVIPIERAKMELALYFTTSAAAKEKVDAVIQEHQDAIVLVQQRQEEDESAAATATATLTVKCVLLADPSLYRTLEDLAKTLPDGKLEILRQVVTLEGDVDLEMEIERKNQLQHKQPQAHAADADDDNDNSSDEDHDDDKIAVDALAKQLQQQKVSLDSDGDHDDHDDSDDDNNSRNNADSENDDILNNNNNQSQKQQKKKQSKKAKRRQREEHAERQARVQVEQERQAQRTAQVEEKMQPIVQAHAEAAAASQNDVKSCNTCGGNFANSAAYRAHFKSDWHRFNQKLKLQGMAPVSEEEFNLCDAESFFGTLV